MKNLSKLSKLKIILIKSLNHIFFSNSCHRNYILFLWIILFRTWRTFQKFDTDKTLRNNFWSWFVHRHRFWKNHDKIIEHNFFNVQIHENVLWFENQRIFQIYHHILIDLQICQSISIHFNVFRINKKFFIFFSLNSWIFFDESYKFSFFDSCDVFSSSDFVSTNFFIVIIIIHSMNLFVIMMLFWGFFLNFALRFVFLYLNFLSNLFKSDDVRRFFFLSTTSNWIFFWIIDWFVDYSNDSIFEKNMNWKKNFDTFNKLSNSSITSKNIDLSTENLNWFVFTSNTESWIENSNWFVFISNIESWIEKSNWSVFNSNIES